MIFEIRDYHYRRDIFAEYRKWAEEEAIPVLRRHMDVVGFWVDGGIEPEITGAKTVDSPIGAANITWIIRWESKEARDAGFAKLHTAEDWKAAWERHPDANGYDQISARFMESA